MSAFAAVMTGRGSGAIATIQLIGGAAEAILTKLFRRPGEKPLDLTAGQVLLGHIFDGDEAVDQVTVGCESPGVFAIHCHGNPLIVERIIGLLQRNGAEILTAEQLLTKTLAAQPSLNSIAAEAKLALTGVKTVAGAEILSHQIESGLSAKVRQWRQELDRTSLVQIAAEAEQILRTSEPARLLIDGCTIALIGPPNTGKSTLLNTLAGREKAVVTDIRGTTRDWVSAEVHIPPLAATIIDTAGLDPSLASRGEIDRAAQRKTIEIIDRADLVLLILDASQPANQLSEALANKLLDKRTVTVLNKTDLPERLEVGSLPPRLGEPVRISAKQGTGIEDLILAVHRTCKLADCDAHAAVVFTDRQMWLLQRLFRAISKVQVRSIVTQLLERAVSNFAAHFDMLGFGNAVLKDFHEAWGALSDLRHAMDRAMRTVVIPIATHVPLVDKVRFKFFSDSVILYTAGDSDDDLMAILIAAATLFVESLRTCVPLRGGIGHGRFAMDPAKGLLMGESLVKAHRIGEDAQWLGIVLDGETAEVARQTTLGEYVVVWNVAGKDGVRTTHPVLNWMKPHADAGSLKKPPITLAEFYQPFERLSGPYVDLPAEVKRKYENTVTFMNAHLPR